MKNKITSRELIARALVAQRVTCHTKVRMSRDLYNRAVVCANTFDESVSRWLSLCTRPKNVHRAYASGVVVPDEMLFATRGSVVATVDGRHADHDLFRLCVAMVVLFSESRRPAPFKCDLREGVDYLLEKDE